MAVIDDDMYELSMLTAGWLLELRAELLACGSVHADAAKRLMYAHRAMADKVGEPTRVIAVRRED